MLMTYSLNGWGLNGINQRMKGSGGLPFILLECEIDDLIAGCSKHISIFLQIAKETGAKARGIFQLNWGDVDFERCTLTITPEKGSDLV